MKNTFHMESGTYAVDPGGKVIVGPGQTIFLITILADVSDVGVRIGTNGQVVVPAGTPFAMGGADFPDVMGRTEVLFENVTGVDPGSRWTIAWGSRCG